MTKPPRVSSGIVIHQPHFCAWLPYFAKIACCKDYVVLDDVSFRRHFYHDRTYLLDTHKNIIQINVPNNGSQNLLIKDVKLTNTVLFLQKFLKTILVNYKKHPYFNEVFEPLNANIKKIETEGLLLNFNIEFMLLFLKIMNINPPSIYYSSKLSDSIERNQRIIDICLSLKHRNIISGWGVSTEIHDLSLMQNLGLRFVSISRNDFIEVLGENLVDGISIVDTLMRKGVKETSEIIEKVNRLYLAIINEDIK